jgi:hypothetical protein
MLVVARVKHVQAANARARGDVFAFATLARPREVDGATTTHGPLARRWARERLGQLVGSSASRDAVTRHALGYGLVSPYTSLVAIGSDVIVQGGVKRSVAVPVSLPSGMQWHAVKQAVDLDTAATAAPSPAEVATRKPARPAPPATAPAPSAAPADRADSAGDSDDSDGNVPRELRPGEVITIQGTAPVIAQGSTKTGVTLTEDYTRNSPVAATESISVGGESRRARLTAALGGGLVLDHGAHGLAALDVRLETNRRISLGVGGALWLVGSDLEARALLSVAFSGIRLGGFVRRLELGLGAGVQLGNGTGPASSLRLRVSTPLRGVGGFLRYDAALLLTRPSLEAEHAIALGLEVSY